RQRQRQRHRRFQYVFVVTYGRSGSTLVQGLLNTLPRTLVRGENGLYLVHLYRALADSRRFRSRHDKYRGRAPSSAFFGVRHTKERYFHRAVRGIVKDSVLGPVDPSSVDRLGFKEVQWHRVEPEEVAGFFDMMDAAFPGARYVLNTRDPEAVLKSGFWRRVDDDVAAQRVEAIKEIQQFLRETRPERVLDVAYEAVTAADQAVQDRQLVALGEFVTGDPVPTELLEAMRATVAQPHGPNSTAAQSST
ncbi:sulfotransferase, partial [Nocardioides aquaticus]